HQIRWKRVRTPFPTYQKQGGRADQENQSGKDRSSSHHTGDDCTTWRGGRSGPRSVQRGSHSEERPRELRQLAASVTTRRVASAANRTVMRMTASIDRTMAVPM